MVQEEFKAMTATPVELITNGFDEDDFTGPFERDEYFNITHTGLFAADGNPLVLWKVLAEKCRSDAEFRRSLRIRLVGKTDKEIVDSIVEAGLADNLKDFGYQPHDVAVKEQKNASILLLPLRQEPEYRAVLPGKLFEYLASRRPILGIGQTDGAMAGIVRDTGSGTVCDWDEEGKMSEWISQAWERFASDSLADNTSDISCYTRRNLTARLALLLDSISEK